MTIGAFETLILFTLLAFALVAFCTSTDKMIVHVLRWIRQLWIESDPDRQE